MDNETMQCKKKKKMQKNKVLLSAWSQGTKHPSQLTGVAVDYITQTRSLLVLKSMFCFVAMNATFIVAEIKSLSNGFGLNWQPGCSKVSSQLQKMICHFLLEVLFTHAFLVWHIIYNLQWFEYSMPYCCYGKWNKISQTSNEHYSTRNEEDFLIIFTIWVHSTEGKQAWPKDGCFPRTHFVCFWGMKELFVSREQKSMTARCSSQMPGIPK